MVGECPSSLSYQRLCVSAPSIGSPPTSPPCVTSLDSLLLPACSLLGFLVCTARTLDVFGCESITSTCLREESTITSVHYSLDSKYSQEGFYTAPEWDCDT
eukprot:750474-Hanusia_phi.AAC.1